MLRFVEEEVDRVKKLYDDKLGRMRAEKDAAEKDALGSKEAAREWEARAHRAEAGAERLREEVGRAESERGAARARADAAEAQAEGARRRVAATEAEMKDLLATMEREREVANRKLRQLGTVLGELQTGLLTE